MSGAYPDYEDSMALLHLRSDGSIDCEFYIQRGRERRGECHYDESLIEAPKVSSKRLSSKVGSKAAMLVTSCGLATAMFWATTLV